jgi:hypothetical protein
MSYLEIGSLVMGLKYVCVPYSDRSQRLILRYVGNGDFKDADDMILTIFGDIRYVLSRAEVNSNVSQSDV